MSRVFFYLFICLIPAAAQTFDNSGVGTLKGDYFVREVLIAGQNADGTISSAGSVMGIVTFDGAGNYSFKGQGTSTAALGTATSQSLTGIYEASGNGLLVMTSLVDQTDVCYGGIAAIGPSAFVASATEGTNIDLLVAIPAGTRVTAASLKGGYTAAYVDYLNADITMLRQASFNLTADGAGNIGSVAVSGTAVSFGGKATNQTVAGVTYTLSGEGSGTVNFGAASSTQLISGAKTLYESADGNIILAANPGGFDMMVGIRGLTGAATNGSSSGLYFVASLEDTVTVGSSTTHQLDAYYGSTNANGAGTAISHNRFQQFFAQADPTQPYAEDVFDFTYDAMYSVASNGTFNDGVYNYQAGASGNAFLALGTNGLYSLVVGFGAPHYSGNGVYLNPTGIVNAASYAPITNPVAPYEVVTLFGSGLAASTVINTVIPLPTTLGGVQVLINGMAAPLFYVSPGQIAVEVPREISPDFGVQNATFQVVNNNVMSNAVTVYAWYESPGLFSAGGNGVGPAAAQHANYTLITSGSPAKVGETIILYGTGFGSVNPVVADGAAAPSGPLSTINDTNTTLFLGQTATTLPFAGLTPGDAGLYQLNATVGAGTASGAQSAIVDTTYSESVEASIAVAGTTGLARTPAAARRPGIRGNMVRAKRRPAPMVQVR